MLGGYFNFVVGCSDCGLMSRATTLFVTCGFGCIRSDVHCGWDVFCRCVSVCALFVL